MKTSITLLFSCLLLSFTACNKSGNKENNGGTSEDNATASADNNGYRYDLKSAIVTSKTAMGMAGGDMTTILSFDKHGEVSLTESINKMTMMGQSMETHTKSLMKDGYIYSWKVGDKTGTKMKMDLQDNAQNLDYKKMSQEMMDKMKIKKTGTGTVMGKKCDIYEMNAESMTGKYYIWDNINMKAETSVAGMNVTVEVTDLKENPNIPASTFELPGDVTFTEMNTSM